MVVRVVHEVRVVGKGHKVAFLYSIWDGLFTMVKGNKYARLAPKVGSVSEIHISHKETCYCGCRRAGFGSCARKNMQLCADQICKATIKIEAQRQAALIYTVA